MCKMSTVRSYNLFCDKVDQVNCINFVSEESSSFIPTGSYIPKNKNSNLVIEINEKLINKTKKDRYSFSNNCIFGFTILYVCIDQLNIDKNTIQYTGLLLNRGHDGNTYPLTKVSDNEYIEGYWFPLNPNESDFEQMYPKPKQQKTFVSTEFLDKLKLLTENNAIAIQYYGSSMCRLCKRYNGSIEYKITQNNITFRYPKGLIHYYEYHNVHPSTEFYEFIMNY